MNSKTRISRLEKLKFMLENHSKLFKTVQFNIETWQEKSCCDSTKKEACGTAACALGSAALYAPFKRMGMGMRESNNFYNGAPWYNGKEGFEAGQDFFGITADESYYLFDPDQYVEWADHNDATQKLCKRFLASVENVKPRHVAMRVGKLIKQYSKAA